MPNAKYIAKKKALGICTDCTKPAFPGYFQCAEHRKAQRLREIKYERANWDKVLLKGRKRKVQRKNEGRCPRCNTKLNQEVDGSHLNCLNCREHLDGNYYETLPKIYAI